jgi:hypothetical protein
MRTGRLAVALLFGLSVLMVGNAHAIPWVSIHSQAEWQAALDDERVRPVPYDVLEQMIMSEPSPWPDEYTGTGYNTYYYTPTLMPTEHGDGKVPPQIEPALYARWGLEGTGPPLGDLQQDDRLVMAWDYVYPEDPDLTGMTLEFSIHAPEESWFVSVNIVDEFGNFREWIWHVGFEPGEIPPCEWTTVTLDPGSILASSSNYALDSAFTVNQPGSQFDLTRVTTLRFDENGRWSGNMLDPETGEIWNAWNHVEVTPEPATMVLLGGGLLALARRRRKRQ